MLWIYSSRYSWLKLYCFPFTGQKYCFITSFGSIYPQKSFYFLQKVWPVTQKQWIPMPCWTESSQRSSRWAWECIVPTQKWRDPLPSCWFGLGEDESKYYTPYFILSLVFPKSKQALQLRWSPFLCNWCCWCHQCGESLFWSCQKVYLQLMEVRLLL